MAYAEYVHARTPTHRNLARRLADFPPAARPKEQPTSYVTEKGVAWRLGKVGGARARQCLCGFRAWSASRASRRRRAPKPCGRSHLLRTGAVSAKTDARSRPKMARMDAAGGKYRESHRSRPPGKLLAEKSTKATGECAFREVFR